MQMMMTKNEFYDWLKETDLEVTFTKVTDGSTRVMKCTLQGPESGIGESVPSKNSTSDTLVTVFDTESNGWRSFYLDSVINIKPVTKRSGGVI